MRHVSWDGAIYGKAEPASGAGIKAGQPGLELKLYKFANNRCNSGPIFFGEWKGLGGGGEREQHIDRQRESRELTSDSRRKTDDVRK